MLGPDHLEPYNFWIDDCYREMQSAIGQQLRKQFKVQSEIPHQLLALMLQLDEDQEL